MKCTPVKRVALKNSEAGFKTVYRELYRGSIKNNPNVADEYLFAIELSARTQDKKTRVPVPAIYPVLRLDVHGIRAVKLEFKDSEMETPGKPQGVSGALVR